MTVLASANGFDVVLSADKRLIDASQALRYEVFFEEMGAIATASQRRARRDVDDFDPYCDHLLVIDQAKVTGTNAGVIGSYRLLPGDVAKRHGGFYTAAEFDLGQLDEAPGERLELGRSCVHRDYRTGPVIQLLWRGIAEYIAGDRFTALFGCASLPGRDIAEVAAQIAYLHDHHLAPLNVRPCAHAHRRIAHEPFAKDYDRKAAFRELPPLMKGYLRLGGVIGDGAVLDEQFNTIDVCLVLPAERIERRYLRHYTNAGAMASGLPETV